MSHKSLKLIKLSLKFEQTDEMKFVLFTMFSSEEVARPRTWQIRSEKFEWISIKNSSKDELDFSHCTTTFFNFSISNFAHAKLCFLSEAANFRLARLPLSLSCQMCERDHVPLDNTTWKVFVVICWVDLSRKRRLKEFSYKLR
jgi:hypothetical protein